MGKIDNMKPSITALRAMLQAGPVVVEFLEGAEDFEAYPEAGMRAHLKGVDAYPDDVCRLTFDYTAFESHNLPFETADFYDQDGRACLTARERGCYMPVEFHYADASSIGDYLRIVDGGRIDLLKEFSLSGEKSYVAWLEGQLMAARGN